MERGKRFPSLLIVALSIILYQPSLSEARTLDADIVVIGAGKLPKAVPG